MPPVPHNPPLGNNEGPANYVAGWNIPDYPPEMDPAFFTEFDDAKRFILNALESLADDLAIHNDDAATEIDSLREDINLESGPFTAMADGLAYWVEPVELYKMQERYCLVRDIESFIASLKNLFAEVETPHNLSR